MGSRAEDWNEGAKIDVRTLPESVALLWEAMLRQNPNWDLSEWLNERASEELELLEVHLGRERLRHEQKLHRIENLVKQLKRMRETAQGTTWMDPHQRNLFDVYEAKEDAKTGHSEQIDEIVPLVDLGSLGSDDDPILTIVAEHIISTIEEVDPSRNGVHFEAISKALGTIGIRTEEVDEALSWLLQRSMVFEMDQDVFVIDG